MSLAPVGGIFASIAGRGEKIQLPYFGKTITWFRVRFLRLANLIARNGRSVASAEPVNPT